MNKDFSKYSFIELLLLSVPTSILSPESPSLLDDITEITTPLKVLKRLSKDLSEDEIDSYIKELMSRVKDWPFYSGGGFTFSDSDISELIFILNKEVFKNRDCQSASVLQAKSVASQFTHSSISAARYFIKINKDYYLNKFKKNKNVVYNIENFNYIVAIMECNYLDHKDFSEFLLKGIADNSINDKAFPHLKKILKMTRFANTDLEIIRSVSPAKIRRYRLEPELYSRDMEFFAEEMAKSSLINIRESILHFLPRGDERLSHFMIEQHKDLVLSVIEKIPFEYISQVLDSNKDDVYKFYVKARIEQEEFINSIKEKK